MALGDWDGIDGEYGVSKTAIYVSGRDDNVTGDIKNLQTNQQADVICDLGTSWQSLYELQIFGFEDGGDMGNPQVFFQDDPIVDASRPAWNMIPNGSGAACMMNVGTGTSGIFRIAGRYCRVRVVSGKQQGETTLGPNAKITFSANS